MTRPRVEFIDTSVFCHIIAVPGRSSEEDTKAFGEEFVRRHAQEGVRFVLPITTIIETGNFIQPCTTGRREAAEATVPGRAWSSTSPLKRWGPAI